jgi:hypothetical protein
MRPEFFDIYQQLTSSYLEIPSSRWFRSKRLPLSGVGPQRALRMVERALTETLQDLVLENRLRPDARHFLVVTMHQMITLPILIEAASSKSVSANVDVGKEQDPKSFYKEYQQLRTDVKHDLRLILQAASEESEFQISGRSVIGSVHRVYDRLKTLASNAWG